MNGEQGAFSKPLFLNSIISPSLQIRLTRVALRLPDVLGPFDDTERLIPYWYYARVTGPPGICSGNICTKIISRVERTSWFTTPKRMQKRFKFGIRKIPLSTIQKCRFSKSELTPLKTALILLIFWSKRTGYSSVFVGIGGWSVHDLPPHDFSNSAIFWRSSRSRSNRLVSFV